MRQVITMTLVGCWLFSGQFVSAQLIPQFETPVINSELIAPQATLQVPQSQLPAIQTPGVDVIVPEQVSEVVLPQEPVLQLLPGGVPAGPTPIEIAPALPDSSTALEMLGDADSVLRPTVDGEAVAPVAAESNVTSGSQLAQTMWTGRNGLPSKGILWLSVEAVFGKYGDSNSLVGDERAPDTFGTRFQAATFGALDGSRVGADTLVPSLIGEQVQNDSFLGTRLRVGYRNDFDGGVEFDGLWMNEGERFWQRGLGGLNAGGNPETVRVTAALPLFDGGDGYAVPFDQFFRIGLETQTNMYGLHVAPQGFWWGAVLLQPTYGMRYMQLDESLGFAAADSGLSYDHNDDGTPVATSLDPPNVSFPPYQSTLNAVGNTKLIGPLLGLNYATTGKIFRINGSTRAGLMFAESEQTLNGQGFGNGFAAGFDPAIAFNDSRDSKYATAMIEQNLNLDIDLLRIVPPFSDVADDHSLVLRLGWSITALHSVVRPADAIRWNGFPLSPELKDNKNNWYLQTWSIGAIFQY